MIYFQFIEVIHIRVRSATTNALILSVILSFITPYSFSSEQQIKGLDQELSSPAKNFNDLKIMEIEEAFAHALGGLPENQRTAILLLKQQELSYLEIATIMESSENVVKSWIFRARQYLRNEMKALL